MENIEALGNRLIRVEQFLNGDSESHSRAESQVLGADQTIYARLVEAEWLLEKLTSSNPIISEILHLCRYSEPRS